MYSLGYLLSALSQVLDIVLTLYMYVIIAGALISWVNPDPFNPIVRFIHNFTEPVLRPVRQRLPMSMGGMDFSPMVVILAIVFLRIFLVGTLSRMAGGFLYR